MSKKIKYIGPLNGRQYYPSVNEKNAIMLHHTAGGSASEAVKWWNQTPDRVGTALFAERNGDALQCFEIAAWAFAMGLNISDAQKLIFEKGTVGIELVSYGFVLPEEKEGKTSYYAYPLWPLKNKRILIEEKEVEELAEPWRGFKFWHKYTDKQIETTIWLCRYLVDRFKINVQKDLEGFWNYDISVAKKNTPGIWSHTTVRQDKWDIYPCPRLINALKAEFNTKPKTIGTAHTTDNQQNQK